MLLFRRLLAARALTVLGPMLGQAPVGQRVDAGAAEKTGGVARKPPVWKASSISSNDSADTSTPLPNAMILAVTRCGTSTR